MQSHGGGGGFLSQSGPGAEGGGHRSEPVGTTVEGVAYLSRLLSLSLDISLGISLFLALSLSLSRHPSIAPSSPLPGTFRPLVRSPHRLIGQRPENRVVKPTVLPTVGRRGLGGVLRKIRS